ncbi:SlyX family protein [Aureimonas psammosilenae]|uniref:SlyX family protein n=1 Tax=Aureimonas psammosilenae TaxID=2495496 RepID=UPI0012605943|nr:SlyX family protein [Aureimonas psammosilenae]
MDDPRIRHLEETLSYQALALEEMSDELRRQGLVIDDLMRALRHLGERFQSVEDALPAPEITRPPHY